MGVSMAVEIDEPSWSDINGADMDGCTVVGKSSSRCLFAADLVGKVLAWSKHNIISGMLHSCGCVLEGRGHVCSQVVAVARPLPFSWSLQRLAQRLRAPTP
jgi:hypothetical protein